MPAAKHDFSIEQGSSYSFILVYKDSEGNIVNLTNWCARLIWKTNSNTTNIFTTGHDDVDYKFSLDGPNGKFTLLWPAETTNGYTFNTAKYDLELQSPDDFYANGGNYTERILYGTVTITKRFSQSNTALECQT